MTKILFSFFLIALLSLAGCGILFSQNSSVPGQPIEDICVDWADVLQFNGTQYISHQYSLYLPDGSMVGKELGKTSFQVSGNITNPSYQLQDGDATFLAEDTPIYELKGFDPKDVVAVNNGTQWVIYCREGYYRPELFPGEHLVHTERIVLLSSPGNIVGEIADPKQVQQFIDIIKGSEAPDELFNYTASNPSYYFYLVIPDEKTGHKLSTLHYIEFDEITHQGCIDDYCVDPALYDLFRECTFK